MNYRKLWIAFILVMVGSFAVLGYFGYEIYLHKPPIPERVVTADGATLFTGEDILDGQSVWQQMGGQEVGTVWGHGAYVAPDWSADWLHRELVYLLELWSNRDYGMPFANLQLEDAARLKQRLKTEIRTNSFSESRNEIVISADRADAMRAVGQHYASLFGNDPELAGLRDAYAVPQNTIRSATDQAKLNAFFFWTSWACATERPNLSITYTNNWPPEDLIDNRPSSAILVWSVVSIILLLAGIGGMIWWYAADKGDGVTHKVPDSDPFAGLVPTPSMAATLKYFWVVTGVIVLQVVMGAITAHYAVEGGGFYGIPLDQILPYSVTRTWHVQMGIFWIATAWLATGLYIAPAVSGYEPKFQRFGVNFLFIALLIIVAGSLSGQLVAVVKGMSAKANFWFGHQGLEYVDLGRFWQLFLFVGLMIWLVLVGRALLPAFKTPGASRHLLTMFLISAIAIGGFYGAGLMWGQRTHLSITEYWRWWVVHLWVEGFFEVFATAVIAFLFTRLGLLRLEIATKAVLLTTVIYLSGGIIGTFHHLYFTGTPTAVLALGATFSALEVVPLVLIGFEGYHNFKLIKMKDWVLEYKLPIWFFVGVAFWNLVGAGIFGFLINPPLPCTICKG